MEEIKKMAVDFAFKFAEEKNIKDPLKMLVLMSIYANGFEYGYTFEGSKEDAKIGETSLNYVKESFKDIDDALMKLLLTTTYALGMHKGFEERDKITIERDENGDITGLTI